MSGKKFKRDEDEGEGSNNNNNMSERERQALEEIKRLDAIFQLWEIERGTKVIDFVKEKKESGVKKLSIMHGNVVVEPTKKIIIISSRDQHIRYYYEATNMLLLEPNIVAPVKRFSSQKFPDGTVILFGGFKNPSEERVISRCIIFDGHTFYDVPDLSNNIERFRIFAATVLLPDGNVLVAGGNNRKYDFTSCYFYNANKKIFLSSTAKMLKGRSAAAMSLFADGKNAIICGGTNYNEEYELELMLRSSEIYDVAKDRFIKGPDMRLPREGHTATMIEYGRVLICGGGGRHEEDRSHRNI